MPQQPKNSQEPDWVTSDEEESGEFEDEEESEEEGEFEDEDEEESEEEGEYEDEDEEESEEEGEFEDEEESEEDEEDEVESDPRKNSAKIEKGLVANRVKQVEEKSKVPAVSNPQQEEEESEEEGGSEEEEEDGEEEDDDDEEEDDEEEDDEEEEETDDEEEEEGETEDEDSDEDESEDESMDDISFDDEENPAGGMAKSLSTGSLMNEPDENPSCMEKYCGCITKCVAAIGVAACAGIVCGIIVLLALIIGLSVGLTNKNKKSEIPPEDAPTPGDITEFPTVSSGATTMLPTTAVPTTAAKIPAVLLSSDADTTIYTDGALQDTANGNEATMLVQNGPAGNTELPTAYSLVQFDGISGIDSDTMSIDAFLNSVENPDFNFCLTRAPAESGTENTESKTYTTCLVPPLESGSIEDLTGTSATAYTMPNDCLNGATATFQVDPSTSLACADVTSLFQTTGGNPAPPAPAPAPGAAPGVAPGSAGAPAPDGTTTTRTRSLRGTIGDEERVLQTNETDTTITTTTNTTATTSITSTNNNTSSSTTYLLMIANLVESDQPGDRFYTRNDPEPGRQPSLVLEGGNTCMTAASLACNNPDLSFLCGYMLGAGIIPFPSTTIFAPTDDAFLRLDPALSNDTDASILDQILSYHLTNGKITSSELGCGAQTEMADSESTTTICSTNNELYQVGNGVVPNVTRMPKVISADNEICEGIVHVIDEVLFPDDLVANSTCGSGENGTINEIVCTTPDLSTLCRLIGQTGLNYVLTGSGEYTVYAPTDTALQAATQNLDVTDIPLVTDVLLQHIVYGDSVDDCDIVVPTANRGNDTIKCEDNGNVISVGGPGNNMDSYPQVVNASISACNGIIYVIDGVILPANLPSITPSSNDTLSSNSTEDDTAIDPTSNITLGTENDTSINI